MRRVLLPLALASALAAVLPGQVSLAELPALARARAEKQRESGEKALGPYWADLALEYKGNEKFLDKRIAEVAALGESVAPLLLERLAPAKGGAEARQLAANCRRVLEQMDTSAVVDALVALATGSNEVGRGEGIRLLGASGSPRAVKTLDAMLATGDADEKQLVVQALTRLRSTTSTPRIVAMLTAENRREREAALDFLVAVRPAGAVDAALGAMAKEKDAKLLQLHAQFLGATAREHDGAARALLDLLDMGTLDASDTRRLVESLARVAPAGHKPTIERLLVILDADEAGSLTLEACTTLKALGDRSGLEKTFRSINKQLAEPRRKRDASLYELRGNLYFAVEKWSDALDDFEKAVAYSDSRSLSRRSLVMMARTEAHRRKWSAVLKHLQAAEVGVADVENLCRQDPAMQEAMQQDTLKAWLTGLGK